MGRAHVIPLKDDIPSRRFPAATVALITAALATSLILTGPPSVWAVVVGALYLWLFGPSLEDAMGPLRYLLFLAGAATAAAAIHPTAAVAGAGAVAGALGGYALLYPRAHVVALGFVPGLMSVFELPALAVLAAWLPLQTLASGTDPAPLAGLAVGMLAVRLMARDPQRDYRHASGVPAY